MFPDYRGFLMAARELKRGFIEVYSVGIDNKNNELNIFDKTEGFCFIP